MKATAVEVEFRWIPLNSVESCVVSWFQNISVISVIWVLFFYMESHTSCFALRPNRLLTISNIHMPSLPNQAILHLAYYEHCRTLPNDQQVLLCIESLCFRIKFERPSPSCPSQWGLETARKSDSEVFWDFSPSAYSSAQIADLLRQLPLCHIGVLSRASAASWNLRNTTGSEAEYHSRAVNRTGKMNKLTTTAGIEISMKDVFAFG